MLGSLTFNRAPAYYWCCATRDTHRWATRITSFLFLCHVGLQLFQLRFGVIKEIVSDFMRSDISVVYIGSLKLTWMRSRLGFTAPPFILTVPTTVAPPLTFASTVLLSRTLPKKNNTKNKTCWSIIFMTIPLSYTVLPEIMTYVSTGRSPLFYGTHFRKIYVMSTVKELANLLRNRNLRQLQLLSIAKL